jgi:hypothetical protein
MGTVVSRVRRWAAAVVMGGFLFSGGMPVVTAPRGETPRPIRTDWPRSFVAGNGATVTIYQPQIAEWPNQSAVTFYAAVAYRPNGAPDALGTVAVEADTTVAFRDRRVHFSRFAVVDANFPTLQPADASQIVSLIEKHLPAEGRTMTLDQVLAAVELRPAAPKNIRGLKADPPPIFISTRPAALVNIDGSPIWHTVGKGPLQYAVNTNWDLIRDPASATYFLRDGRSWLAASNVLGPWTRPRTLPASFNHLPDGPRWEPALASVPPSTAAPTRARAVFVSRQPAELIEFAGDPVYRPVPGTTKLQWVSNTDSDVFREGRTGTVYYLVAGRWFAAPDFTGPWTFATPTLPAEFRKIPLEHPRSHVLASVPGTPQAAAAVLLAQARRAARVNKKGLKAPVVVYDGPPSFLLVPDTPVARAVNTDKDVLKAGRLYYLCHDGVWFSGDTATGPWRVTGTIPAAIYQIPPSSPAYRVTHVVVEDDYEDWAVFATTDAYTGTMVAGDTVVWGTGIGYVAYVGQSARDPMYVARPSTYGVGAWYNPWTATFGRGRGGYGPSAEALAARAFDSWDVRLVQRADRSSEPLSAARDVVGTSGQLARSAPTNRDGHVYAGRDGIVYRQRAGVWEKYGKAGWIAVVAPSANEAPIVRQLDADARARSAGAERTRAAVGLEREWGPRAASYRPVSTVRRGEP